MKDFILKFLSHYLVKITIWIVSWLFPTIIILWDKYTNMLSNIISHYTAIKLVLILAFTLIYCIVLLFYFLYKKTKSINNLKIKNEREIKDIKSENECKLKEIKLENKRINKIANITSMCRKLIDKNNVGEREFRSTVEYSMLRPFVSNNFKKRVESGHINIAIGHGRGCGGEQFKVSLLDELVRIEQEYSIIPTPNIYKT